jgi:hypothetical protein
MNDSVEQLKNGAKNMLTSSNDALESALSLFFCSDHSRLCEGFCRIRHHG